MDMVSGDSWMVTYTAICGWLTTASGVALAVSIAMKIRMRREPFVSWLVGTALLFFLWFFMQWAFWYI